MEFLSGYSKNLIFDLWVEIQEFKKPELVEWPYHGIMVGDRFVGNIGIKKSPPIFSLKFKFTNLGRDISQLFQAVLVELNRIRITANTKQVDSVFLCISWKINYEVSKQGGNDSSNGVVSMSLREETAWDTTARG